MNTLQTQNSNENASIKRLFRELFLIQIRLENHTDQQFRFSHDVKELIQTIDRLMEIMINMNDC